MNVLQTPIKLPKLTALKPAHYPTKTTLNLCIREKSANRPTKIVPTVVLCAAIVALIAQFAVIGRWQAVDRAETAAQESQAKLSELKEYTQGYESLRLEYAQHFPADGSAVSALADRMDLLALLEKPLLAAGRVEYFTIEENILSAKVAGVALDDTAGILEELYKNPLVKDVSVFTADKDTDTAVPSVLITVNLGDIEKTEETP